MDTSASFVNPVHQDSDMILRVVVLLVNVFHAIVMDTRISATMSQVCYKKRNLSLLLFVVFGGEFRAKKSSENFWWLSGKLFLILL